MIHGLTSLLVGLLYGALLPMYPRNPIFTAGITVPLLFTGIIHSALWIVSPILNERIDWFWFVISQIAFGLVCGYVVNRHARIRTPCGSKSGSGWSRAGRRRPMISISKPRPPGPSGEASSAGT